MSALFSPKKTHTTQNVSSRQTVSGPQDKKNPNTLLFNKEVGEPFNEESGRFQEKTLKLLVPNNKRLGGYTQMEILFSSKRYTPCEDLMKCYTVSLKKALGRRLFLLDKT